MLLLFAEVLIFELEFVWFDDKEDIVEDCGNVEDDCCLLNCVVVVVVDMLLFFKCFCDSNLSLSIMLSINSNSFISDESCVLVLFTMLP